MVNPVALDIYFALGRPFENYQVLDENRFSAAAWPDDYGCLSLFYRDGNIIKNSYRAGVIHELLGEIFYYYDSIVGV
jgi:hypothetical protein